MHTRLFEGQLQRLRCDDLTELIVTVYQGEASLAKNDLRRAGRVIEALLDAFDVLSQSNHTVAVMANKIGVCQILGDDACMLRRDTRSLEYARSDLLKLIGEECWHVADASF
jgi:hypothetical protein